MSFQRYSAVPVFSIPIEGGIDPYKRADLEGLVKTYAIEPQGVPEGPEDLTPYYSTAPLSCFVSLRHPEGPVVIEFIPRQPNRELVTVARIGTTTLLLPGSDRLEIPTDRDYVGIFGLSPRFPDKLCLHELITYTD